MTGLTRVALSQVQPGDEVRLTRNSLPYRVESIRRQDGSWTVLDQSGTAHHYPDGAAVWRTDTCTGQTALLDVYDLEEPHMPEASPRPLDAALGYAEWGWAVFPLRPGDKRPAVTDWETRATTDVDRIRRRWPAGGYGVGIACGPSDLVVVDLDVPKPGNGPLPGEWQAEGVEHGLDVLAVLADRAGEPLPLSTYLVRTGGGGVHLYFASPAGEPLRNTQRHLGPMVDSRAHGGYVVAPPTIVAGRPYRLVTDVPPDPLPGWLADLLAPAPLPAQQPVSVALPDDRHGAYLRAALEAEVARVRSSPPGGRNTAVYRAAVALGQLVAGSALDHDQVVGVLTAAAIEVGQEPRESSRTVASGLRAGARRPRTVAA